MNTPCEGCPVLAICRLKDNVECPILAEFMKKRRPDDKGSLKDVLNLEIFIWNPETNVFNFIRDKKLADDLREAGKQSTKWIRERNDK